MATTEQADRTRDEQDIVRATHIYALGLDRFEPALALSAFTADAVWDATAVGLGRLEGHEQILEFFENDAKAIERQFHILTNHVVEFQDEDHARGTNYVFSEGETVSGASFKAIALNEDTYERTAAGWRIAGRVISPLTTPQMEGFEV